MRLRSNTNPSHPELMALIFVALALMVLPQAAAARELPAANPGCEETLQPIRWVNAKTPDEGLKTPFISAHRGGVNLAPENTLWAYRHAFAYGADVIEIDVRQTVDGHFFAMHDATADRTTDGTGRVDLMNSDQIRQLNAADYAPWSGSEYDPSPVPFLDEILALAQEAGGGIEFDLKSVRNYRKLMNLVGRHEGLIDRSYFNAQSVIAHRIHGLNPRARFIFNLSGKERSGRLFFETFTSSVFGSRLTRFTAEKIAAVHDGCGWIIPHSYDQGPNREAEQFELGRSMGADGAQVNQVDVIRAAMKNPIPTVVQLDTIDDAPSACLVNANNGLGVPQKTVKFFSEDDSLLGTAQTDRWGCAAPIPDGFSRAEFEGDETAQPAIAQNSMN